MKKLTDSRITTDIGVQHRSITLKMPRRMPMKMAEGNLIVPVGKGKNTYYVKKEDKWYGLRFMALGEKLALMQLDQAYDCCRRMCR